jgi:inhibitor of cysteine peptidase
MKRYYTLLAGAMLWGVGAAAGAGTACIQVITYAQNPTTGTWIAFPTPCDVPKGWTTSSTPPDGYQPYPPMPTPCVALTDQLDFALSCAISQGQRYQLSFNETGKPRLQHLEDNRWRVSQATPGAMPEQASVEVGPDYDGKRVELPVGSLLQVVLPSNPTTGYSWAALPGYESVLTLVDNTYTSECPTDVPMAGCGGRETWTFVLSQAGEVDLSLAYRRPWETSGEPADTFDLAVKAVAP